MKKLYLTIIVSLFALTGTYAQQYRTAYFMEGSTMRSYLNPALRPDRGYVDIPVLGTFSLNFNSNALALNQIFYPVEGSDKMVSLFDYRVKWADISPTLKKNNNVAIDLHTTILGGGFYIGKGFWTIDISTNIDAGFRMPKDAFEMLKLSDKDTPYDLQNIGAGANAYANIAVGYSHRITDELTVGGRINFKAGLARMNINYDHLNVALNGDKWGVEAQGSMEVAVNGFQAPLDSDNYLNFDEFNFGDAFSNIKGTAGFGMTFDLGAEYIFLDRFKFSAAILNIGFMNWSEKHTFRGISDDKYEFGGIDITYDPDTGQWESSEIEEFNLDMRFKEQGGKGRTKMYPGFVLGAEYDIFGDNLLGAGMLFTHKQNEFNKRTEFALSATVRPTDWFTAALSYSVGNYKNIGDNFFNSWGLAVNFHTSWINFFLGTDFMMFKVNPWMIPTGQKVFNINIGLSVPLPGPKYPKRPNNC